MMKFSNTDSGKFREIAYNAGIKKAVDCKIYNDLDRRSNTRRLKMYYVPGVYSSDALLQMEKAAKDVWGARFIRFGRNGGDGDFCLHLDDNKGSPLKPVKLTAVEKAAKKAAAPKYPRYRRPKKMDLTAKSMFWRDALALQSHQFVPYDTVRTLKRDICVFKKVYTDGYWNEANHAIANLIIPAGSKVYLTSNKCRADKASVDSIFMQCGARAEIDRAQSGHTTSFTYTSGEMVYPKSFGRYGQCSGGIHFFIDINEAMDY